MVSIPKNRVLVTSLNAETRRLSTRRSITIVLNVSWCLLQNHALIFTEITEFGPNFFICFYRPVKNIRRTRNTMRHPQIIINPQVTTISRTPRLQSKDQQLF
ncbi:hypothetical protein I4U23_012670 [Adineta vaga]|nr:hypothetical protein I4U23_012670 [Adineta vaga]